MERRVVEASAALDLRIVVGDLYAVGDHDAQLPLVARERVMDEVLDVVSRIRSVELDLDESTSGS